MDSLIIQQSPALRNVPTNALKNVILAKKTLFYGVNGAGKTTICNLLADIENLRFKEGKTPKNAYAFTADWASETVGEFVQGGSAPSIATVVMGEGAKEVERQLKDIEGAIEDETIKYSEKAASVKEFENRQDQLVDKVFDGIRKELEPLCDSLAARKFNRRKIRETLERGNNTALSPSEVRTALAVSSAEVLPQVKVSEFKSRWTPSVRLKELIEKPVATKSRLVVTRWVKEGFDSHFAGDECRFCGNVVTESRVKALAEAIESAEESVNDEIGKAIKDASDARQAVLDWIRSVEQVDIEESDEIENFRAIKLEVLQKSRQILKSIDDFRDCATDRKANPSLPVNCPEPLAELLEESSEYKHFMNAIEEINLGRASLDARRETAVENLKRHCCSTDGAGWGELETSLRSAVSEKLECESTLSGLRLEKRQAEEKLSTTKEVADFISHGLAVVLGEANLTVKESEDGKSYELQRVGEKATFLSEGEKKLVSLLYFCSTLREPHNSSQMAESLVIFDDLASELDQTRQANISRFIDDVIRELNNQPLAVCYFTHSSAFLRQKLIQMGKKVRKGREKGAAPNAEVYEVYKLLPFGSETGKTKVKAWPEQALSLGTDYEFAFYKVCTAITALNSEAESDDFDMLVGNYCRKILEVFSEFKRPVDDKFGKRVEQMIQSDRGENSISPALSRKINALCHSFLALENPLWSRQNIINAVKDTLQFVYHFDALHLELMVKRVASNDVWNDVAAIVRNS